jgi:maltooligosyltrehalose trehalohydrolase
MTEVGASIGARIHDDAVIFRVWAPLRRSLSVQFEGRRALGLTAGTDGLFEGVSQRLPEGTRYRYLLDDTLVRPDPASRHQPDGVHGASALVDPRAFLWTDEGFRGHALSDLVIYELHVGTFSAAGTFEGVIPHLPYLVDLGVTAIELMPIAEFPGSRNWGYDGVYLFAPQSTYGGPAGLRRLIDAAHRHGLSVLLDVVYNHFGPEGNYTADYGPYFTKRHRTLWGEAVNFDGQGAAGVRQYVVANAAHWVREYHVDGLRLDSIHDIHDDSPVHILKDVIAAAEEEAAKLGRPVHVIAESHDNDVNYVVPRAGGGFGFAGVWSDDFHHALHTVLTGERGGYYVDFGRTDQLARAIGDGFAYQGEMAEYFGRPRGTPSRDVPGEHFVFFTQNHDQIGNRARGDRLSALVPFEAVKLAAALLFVSPAVPLLFMGEEYGDTAPFQFFTSFLDPALAEAVRQGRTKEFARFAWQGAVPDPGDPATFVRSRLSHSLRKAPRHRELLSYYRRWIELRKKHPALGTRGKAETLCELGSKGTTLTVSRRGPGGERIVLAANLTADSQEWTPPGREWRVLLDSSSADFAGPPDGRGRPNGPHTPGIRGAPFLLPYQALLYESAVS